MPPPRGASKSIVAPVSTKAAVDADGTPIEVVAAGLARLLSDAIAQKKLEAAVDVVGRACAQGLIVDDGDATTLINLLFDGGKTALALAVHDHLKSGGGEGGEGGEGGGGGASEAVLRSLLGGLVKAKGSAEAATRAVAAWEELRAAARGAGGGGDARPPPLVPPPLAGR